MNPPQGSAEPKITNWQRVPIHALLDRLGLPGREAGNRVIMVDGRSASGKTTLASRLQTVLSGSVVVHTDDVAWNHSFFDWDSELIENVIAPVRRNEPVRYQPPGGTSEGPDGVIMVDQGRDLIVEGVGAGRASIAAWADAVVWVQSDFEDARVRGIARDLAHGVRDAAGTEKFWEEWMRSELPFLEADRPWQRAKVIVAGRTASVEAGEWVDIAKTPPSAAPPTTGDQ